MGTVHAQRQRKYAIGEILGTSERCAWSTISADHLRYPPGIAPPIDLELTEVVIAIGRDDALITRRAGGELQSCRSAPGIAWLCPVGVREDEVTIHAAIELLHLYLPASQFLQLSDVYGGPPVPATAVGYIDGIRDELIHQIGLQILRELQCQTASGRVLVDALSLSLTARLAQAYAVTHGRAPTPRQERHGLDEARLGRVLDYMHTHIEKEMGIGELASVACLSAFHFVRMFRASTGVPPHRYLSSLRLKRAKVLLACGNTSIADIALATCFSSQANFTRAFRAATGTTPGQFRRQSR